MLSSSRDDVSSESSLVSSEFAHLNPLAIRFKSNIRGCDATWGRVFSCCKLINKPRLPQPLDYLGSILESDILSIEDKVVLNGIGNVTVIMVPNKSTLFRVPLAHNPRGFSLGQSPLVHNAFDPSFNRCDNSNRQTFFARQNKSNSATDEDVVRISARQ